MRTLFAAIISVLALGCAAPTPSVRTPHDAAESIRARLLARASKGPRKKGPSDFAIFERSRFGGRISASNATAGQALIRQADGTWAGASAGASTITGDPDVTVTVADDSRILLTNESHSSVLDLSSAVSLTSDSSLALQATDGSLTIQTTDGSISIAAQGAGNRVNLSSETDDVTITPAAGKAVTVDGDLTATGYVVPKCAMVVVERLTAQAVLNGADTYISWDTETRDDLGISAVGGGANVKVCTFASTGTWDCKVSGEWVGAAAGQRFMGLELYDSGNVLKWSSYDASTPASASGWYSGVADTLRVVSGDHLKIWTTQTSGGTLNIGGTEHRTHCTLTRVGN